MRNVAAGARRKPRFSRNGGQAPGPEPYCPGT